MSFASVVKNEVSKLEKDDIYNISTLSAIIRLIGNTSDSIKIMTENASVARYVFKCFKTLFNINLKVTVRKGYNFNKNYIYILETKNKKETILKEVGLFNRNIPEEFIIGDEELIRSYLRGVFISVGSINDPKTSRYHLEFLVDNIEYANFLSDLLNNFDLNCKILNRDNKYMVYIKEAEKIGDFLRIIEASSALLYYEDIRIYRDHKNMTNRLNNCEQANVDKIINTAYEQIKDINTIKDLDLLGEKEKVVAYYRLKYPEASLLELSKIISMETGSSITKSGLYHRFKKINLLADRIRKSNVNKNE